MKKTISIILMALLIISIVPLVAAEDSIEDIDTIEVESEAEQDTCINRLEDRFPRASEGKIKGLCKLKEQIRTETRERIQNTETETKLRVREEIKDGELRIETRERIRNQLTQFKQVRKAKAFEKFKENEFRARELTKERIQNARDKFSKAKERYKNAKENYLTAKDKVKDIKERKAACLEDEDNEDCGKVKTDTIEFLQESIELAYSNLEKVKSKIEESEDLSEEEVTEMLEKVDSAFEELDEIKEKADALTEDSTRKEINEVAKDLKRIWNRTLNRAKVSAGKLVNARIGRIIVRSHQLEAKLELVLERAEKAELDTSGLQNLIGEFNTDLESARESYEEALGLYKDADTAEDVEEAIKKANDVMKEAQEGLKDSHEKLKEIFEKLKEQKADGYLKNVSDEDVEDELEEEDEEETDDEDELDEDEEETDDEDELDEDEEETDDENELEDDEEDTCTVNEDCDDDEECLEGECEDKEEESS